jgi:hypothetical protein
LSSSGTSQQHLAGSSRPGTVMVTGGAAVRHVAHASSMVHAALWHAQLANISWDQQMLASQAVHVS